MYLYGLPNILSGMVYRLRYKLAMLPAITSASLYLDNYSVAACVLIYFSCVIMTTTSLTRAKKKYKKTRSYLLVHTELLSIVTV